MQVASTNEQNIDLQNVQQQVIVNVKSPQGQASSIQKKHICYFEDCDDSFLYPYDLRRHIELHKRNKIYECDIDKCKKKFISLKKLRAHKTEHVEILSYTCSTCNTTFAENKNLTAHYKSRNHLAVLSKTHKYTCDICPETFHSIQIQECHYLKLHPEYKAYLSTVCDNRFNTIRAKNSHYIKYHTGKTKAECKQKKIHKCDLCAKTCRTLSNLKRHHKDQHPNEKPYICNFCDKSFFYASAKARHHKEKHPNEKPLKNYQTTLASNDQQNFYQDENKDQTLELADQSLPSISSEEDINNTKSNQYLGEITQLDMTSIEETINEDNNQYQLSEWPDDCQLDIESEEDFINENDISDISYDINELKQMIGW